MSDVSASPDLGFVHRFVPGAAGAGAPLFALHGTGGNENDLLPLASEAGPGRAVLSPRGPVREAGMARFFRRFPDGRLDEDDLRAKAGELARFVEAARAAYRLPAPVAFGFSNGANIAAGLLMLEPDALAGAVLFRPMNVLEGAAPPPLERRPVLILSATHDVFVSVRDAERLAARLADAGAIVEHRVLPAEHGLTPRDVALSHDWLGRAP